MNQLRLSQSYNPANQLHHSNMSNISTFSMLTPELAGLLTPEIKIEENSLDASTQACYTSLYKQQIAKLVHANTVVMAQLSSALEEKKIVMQLIASAKSRQSSQGNNLKEKRFRRSVKQIERKFQCSEKNCRKYYGSQGSLAQHIRLKHPKTNSHDPPLIPDPC